MHEFLNQTAKDDFFQHRIDKDRHQVSQWRDQWPPPLRIGLQDQVKDEPCRRPGKQGKVEEGILPGFPAS